jgi:hypothetical protein
MPQSRQQSLLPAGLIGLIQCNSKVLVGKLRIGFEHLHNGFVMRATGPDGYLSFLQKDSAAHP